MSKINEFAREYIYPGSWTQIADGIHVRESKSTFRGNTLFEMTEEPEPEEEDQDDFPVLNISVFELRALAKWANKVADAYNQPES